MNNLMNNMNNSATHDLSTHGWPTAFIGELDHRILRAPGVKLRSVRQGAAGDQVFCVDLRIRRPNADEFPPVAVLHSMEHFLLEGFQRLMPDHFVSVGVMGCRTGFYLVFINEGRAKVICAVLQTLLAGVEQAKAVPYARIDQCGDYINHNLNGARRLAAEILSGRKRWLKAA